jgi:hypothetical protein
MEKTQILYSFRPSKLIPELVSPQPELATLAAIQAKLVEAARLADARRFQASIESYKLAQSMIFGHLTAKKSVPGGIALDFEKKWKLFDSLLSASSEWLNIIPVSQPKTSVRPRITVDQTTINAVTEHSDVGLFSEALSSQESFDASADLQLAARMKASGNTSAAEYFRNRAKSKDQTTFDRLSEAIFVSEPGTFRMTGDVLGLRSFSAQAHLSAADAAGTVASRALELNDSVQVQLPPEVTNESRKFATRVGENIEAFSWQSGSTPPQNEIKQKLYDARIKITEIAHLIKQPTSASEAALYLPHSYYYVIPLGLAECYRGLGDYEPAEAEFLNAAAYPYLNKVIEAPFLWCRLAETYLQWANSLYLADESMEARKIYERIVKLDNTEPQGVLYSTQLATGAEAARKVIASLDHLLIGNTDADSLDVNPSIVAVVLEAYEHLIKIEAQLDFYGQSAAMVPIWTFDYLQSAAINFAQLAIAAERDFIQFQERNDQGSLTREQLRQGFTVARAEKAAVKQQTAVANAEVAAYEAAVQASDKRAENAWANAEDYERSSAGAMIHQALAAQLSGGDSGDPAKLNAYADTMMGQGETAEFLRKNPEFRLSGTPALLAAASGLVASRLSAAYELGAMYRQAEEMEIVAQQARYQLKAAKARAKAARAAETVATARETAAKQILKAFNAQYFTPEVWGRMAETMRGLSRRYLHMAIRTARMMQRAYNFETDQELNVIKLDYSAGEVKGLLAADLLMADIQSFTFNLITGIRSKPQPLSQTISLAERHAYAFENELRKTGTMEFQTQLEDFDEAYPGTYAGRIEAVEVAINGIIPPLGISGALTNGGISRYRTLLPDEEGNYIKTRVQSKETLILSDYDTRSDALVNPEDQRMTRIFQGAGLASAWRLELPPELNDIDYQTLTDVRITFHYKARFDPELRMRVLGDLRLRPGVNERQIGLPLRWLFPDAFFHFYETGILEIPIERAMFPANQLDPTVSMIGLLVVTTPPGRREAIVLRLSAPEQDPVITTTDEGGAAPAGELEALKGGSVFGDWKIELRADDNPTWVENGKLHVNSIQNVALILGYSFTSRKLL